MEVFQRNFILILVCGICYGQVRANSIINQVDERAQKAWPSCLITIAGKHFVNGSSVAIVSASETNMGREVDISEWIAQNLMKTSRWSVALKTINGIKIKQEDVK